MIIRGRPFLIDSRMVSVQSMRMLSRRCLLGSPWWGGCPADHVYQRRSGLPWPWPRFSAWWRGSASAAIRSISRMKHLRARSTRASRCLPAAPSATCSVAATN